MNRNNWPRQRKLVKPKQTSAVYRGCYDFGFPLEGRRRRRYLESLEKKKLKRKAVR